MKHKIIKCALTATCLLFCTCSSSKDIEESISDKPETGTTKGKYTNPVIATSVPDPTIIRADDGYFYLYGTEDIHNLPIFRSENLVEWEQCGTAFTDATRPQDLENVSLWAPEIRHIKDKYVLFYSLAKWGQEWISTIGYAISDKPDGPFHPKGVVFSSHDVNVQNSIDQFFYEENGKHYMLWGSFRGIYLMELNIDDDLTITPKIETKQQIAGTAFEAVNVWKREQYYYLFASIGSCCDGANSTYTTVVGRSRNLAGPYVDKNGNEMLNNGYTTVISKSLKFVGTGHNSILVKDDNGDTWMLYHAFRADAPDNGRMVMLDRVLWDSDGWPYVKNGQPSNEADVPVINMKNNR